MDNYKDALEAMSVQFGRDYQFAMATVRDGLPALRYVDAYFDGKYFWIVTHAMSGKARDISTQPAVSLCSRRMHSFSGIAENMGHPLKAENAAIREKLIAVFEPWYFRHTNEADENMCYIRITPEHGFFHADGMGCSVDFVNRTAEVFDFAFDTMLTED